MKSRAAKKIEVKMRILARKQEASIQAEAPEAAKFIDNDDSVCEKTEQASFTNPSESDEG